MRQLAFFLCLLTLPLLAKVEVVMFFSPDCSHCHDVLDETIPPLMEKYGDQFEIVLVNVATENGSKIYYDAARKYNIPESDWGVPTLIIGDAYLVGSKEIPPELPPLIEKGIASGGVPLPDIPGLSKEVKVAESNPYVDRDIFILDSPRDIKYLPRKSVAEKITSDPLGSSLAVALLVGMLASLVFVASSWIHHGMPQGPSPRALAWLFPTLCLGGLAIATYLTYLEMTGHSALCGPIGNCDEVQQSPWAWLFGVLPVGLLGMLGYAAMGITWAIRQFSKRRTIASTLLPILTYASVLFGAYLTFLEPFVIGAVCTWCLVSGALTLALLWLNSPCLHACSDESKRL